VLKSGDARVAMIGFPSVGKSTLLSSVTKTESVQAAYEFTTLTCIPGVIEYKVLVPELWIRMHLIRIRIRIQYFK
jgi:small GTP-binding protein